MKCIVFFTSTMEMSCFSGHVPQKICAILYIYCSIAMVNRVPCEYPVTWIIIGGGIYHTPLIRQCLLVVCVAVWSVDSSCSSLISETPDAIWTRHASPNTHLSHRRLPDGSMRGMNWVHQWAAAGLWREIELICRDGSRMILMEGSSSVKSLFLFSKEREMTDTVISDRDLSSLSPPGDSCKRGRVCF